MLVTFKKVLTNSKVHSKKLDERKFVVVRGSFVCTFELTPATFEKLTDIYNRKPMKN